MTESMDLKIRENSGAFLIPVRVTPRASKNEILGISDGRLRVRLQAPPVEGAANKALSVFLADVLGLPPSAVTVDRGRSGREKMLRVSHSSVTAARLTEKLLLQ
ncbi:MAG: hypothetical protein K0Q91_1616 [Fibrobacteria bacterium]|jgi:uncharacterized protein (TIGR00251 family)|nr:hypothetical protein [Fibrobacteria bacterium]